jgi:alpha-ketoglutarate-dependent taurine dioxygenase
VEHRDEVEVGEAQASARQERGVAHQTLELAQAKPDLRQTVPEDCVAPCGPELPSGSILHLVLPSGGDTLWTSMQGTCKTLSPRLQAYLEGLIATHAGEHGHRGQCAT